MSAQTTARESKSPRKVIITCAVTGSIHTPSMSPHLPVTAREIEEAAVGAVEAGAAIVHLHARDPVDGRPSQQVDLFRAFVGNIKRRTNGVINLTTGGAQTMTTEERLQPALVLKPEVASLNMGSMNFALHPMLGKYKSFKHDWEPKYLEATRDLVFRNTFKDIEYILTSCTDNGTRFEFECYDTAHLYNLKWLLSGFGVVMIGRRDQGADEGAQERLPAAPGIVDELEEAEIDGQLLPRDAAVRPQPGP